MLTNEKGFTLIEMMIILNIGEWEERKYGARKGL
ncbi:MULTISPECIES: prepilin-type N-terminal cleavage/methylation domain-containing protein [unclassified Sporosarcina]|nr:MULTISPECIES: prepilin-type N-terminal cleavage/methylation domain-containing protein [unclassified Sporosarcina]